MYSINVPYTVEKIESTKGKKYLLTVNNKPYSIGELMFIIINSIADGQSVDDITRTINQWAGDKYTFTAEKLQHIIENNIRPLGIFDGKQEDVASGYMANIHGKWTLASYRHISGLLNVIQYLFHPVVFLPVLLGTVGLNTYYMIQLTAYSSSVEAMFAAQGACLWSLSNVPFYYPLAFLIIFFHELGHAAAAHRFGIKTKRIGFGLYLIFPVMFADVTNVWKLSRMKRTIVNLGGIYVQLIINLVLIYYIYHSPDFNTTIIIRYLITANVAMIIVNINPFFKFDGYWVYGDLFNLPNLKQQSNAYMIRLAKRLFPRMPVEVDGDVKSIMNPKNPFLIAYSLLKYVFVGYVFYLVSSILFNLIADIKAAAVQLYQLDFSVCAIESYTTTLFTTGVFAFIGYRIVSQFAKRSAVISEKVRAHYHAR